MCRNKAKAKLLMSRNLGRQEKRRRVKIAAEAMKDYVVTEVTRPDFVILQLGNL